MVVAALMQLAVAAPIGALFGMAYGTSIRIGYEIIYPALFADKVLSKDVDATLAKMQTTFTAIGGLEAQAFGINTGIKNALKSIEADPELIALIKKNSGYVSQDITVNLSGTSQQTSSVPSPSSPSDIGFAGGLAERHRKLREALSLKNTPENRARLSAEYSQIFRRYEQEFGTLPVSMLEEMINVNKKLRWNFVNWDMNWFTVSLQQELLVRFKKSQESRITVTDKLPPPQIAVGAVGTKKAAGQSQKLERGVLMRRILRVKTILKTNQLDGVTLRPVTRINLEKDLINNQQALSNLLARYRF